MKHFPKKKAHISLVIDSLGGFQYFLFSSLFGEKIPILTNVFQMGGSTTNQQQCFQRFLL